MSGYQTILVGTDYSKLGDLAVQTAYQMARRHGAQRLHVLHVVDMAPTTTSVPYAFTEAQVVDMRAEEIRIANGRLAKVVIPDHPGLEITREARVGVPTRELISVAESIRANLIVTATHGYGPIRRAIMGSVTNALIRAAHCPVLIVGEDRPLKARVTGVLAAVDLSTVSEHVIRNAVQVASANDAKLHVLSLFESPLVTAGVEGVLPRYLSAGDLERCEADHRAAVQKLVDSVPHEGVEVKVEVMSKAPPSWVIMETAQILESDLIVMGTSGHGAWHRMLIGATTSRVASEADRPVLVIPHDVTA